MPDLFAEPYRSGWIIADRAGNDEYPGIVYRTKREAVAVIRTLYRQRVILATGEAIAG